jgi:hypothetical protein
MKSINRAALAATMLCTLALAACATGPNPLDPQTRGSFYIKAAPVDWVLNDAKKAGDADYVKGKKEVADRLEATVEREFKNSPSGSQPAHFQIKIKTYLRAGTLAGNLIGLSNEVLADVDVVRDSDGKVLGTYKDVMGMYSASGGVLGAMVQSVSKPDIPQIMAAEFTKNLRKKFEGS